MSPPAGPTSGGAGFTGRQPGAVRNALTMLEAVAQLGPGTSAKEIARFAEVPPATTYRMLNLLVADGYLVRVPDLSGFALGRRITELAQAPAGAPAGAADGAALHDITDELRSETRFGIHVASFARGRLQVVDQDPDHEIVGVGLLSQAPHANALGKVMLAHHPQHRPESELRRLTEHTIVDHGRLDDELRSVVRSGYAWERQESRLGRAALAVPIRDAAAFVVGGLYLQGSEQRVRPEDRDLLRFLVDGAARLSGRL